MYYHLFKIIYLTEREAKRIFEFEGCFEPEASQKEVFELTQMNKYLDAVLNGFSSTIFVYGQTGSGKTYT